MTSEAEAGPSGGTMAGSSLFPLTLPSGIRLTGLEVGTVGAAAAARADGSADGAADGGAQAPTVMFLHGFPEAAFAWQPVMERLSAECRMEIGRAHV